MKGISESIQIYDNELLKIVTCNQQEKPKLENTGNKIQDGCSKVSNKIVYFGQASTFLFKQQKLIEKKIENLQEQILKKVEIEDMNEKLKNVKTKLMTELEDTKKKTNKQIEEQIRKSNTQLQKLESELKETEKKTLWRIQDCEQLLTKRVSNEYLENSLRVSEDKIRREMNKMKDDSFGNLNKSLEDIQDKVTSFEENYIEKIKNIKSSIKALEDQFQNKFTLNDNFDNFKKGINEKIADFEIKFINLERKGDGTQALETSRDLIRQLEIKFYEQQRQLDEISDQTQISNNKGNNDKKGSNQKIGEDCVDLHKICSLESSLKRLREEFLEQKKSYNILESDLTRKVDILEQKMVMHISQLRKNQQSEVNKDEIYEMIDKIRYQCEDKIRNQYKEIEDLRPKINNMNELEKRIKKKIQELNNNQDMTKKLQEKANQVDVDKQNCQIDDRIRQLNEMVMNFKKQFETVEQFYYQLNTMISSNQEEAISIITGNQKYIPNRCAACGNKGKQVINHNEARGSDGKIYKADFNGSIIYENQEVYDVFPSQFSPEKKGKQQIISYKEKNGKTYLQNSANK